MTHSCVKLSVCGGDRSVSQNPYEVPWGFVLYRRFFGWGGDSNRAGGGLARSNLFAFSGASSSRLETSQPSWCLLRRFLQIGRLAVLCSLLDVVVQQSVDGET